MERWSKTLRFSALAMLMLFAAGCRDKAPDPSIPTSAPHDFAAPGIVEVGQIKSRGTVQPAQKLQLSFGVGGVVRSVLVRVGVEVEAGEVLAELDTTALEFELQRARESVSIRESEMDGLLNGSSAALTEGAEMEHTQQVAQAEIALEMARWQLEEARIGEQGAFQANALAVALAKTTLEQLDLQLAQARTQSPTVEVVAAQVKLARAQDALNTAQEEYQKALDRHWEPQEVRDAYAKGVWRAEQELQLTQAQLEGAVDAQRAHALGLEVLAAQRNAAAIQLTQTLQARVAYTATFALLEAEIDLAQLQLDGLKRWQNPYLDPPPREEIAQMEALLRQAELAVSELEWRMEGAKLRAPFDSVVSAVPVSVGEWAAPGEMVIELIDVSRWHVETTSVSELDIARVGMGQEAVVRINAIPDETLRGYVVMIAPVAVVQQGDTTYTLTIELEPTDLNLRPGMTVQVEILMESGR